MSWCCCCSVIGDIVVFFLQAGGYSGYCGVKVIVIMVFVCFSKLFQKE